jgi:hypothetical protein
LPASKAHSFELKQQFYSMCANLAIHQSFDWPSDDNNKEQMRLCRKLFVVVMMMLATMAATTMVILNSKSNLIAQSSLFVLV